MVSTEREFATWFWFFNNAFAITKNSMIKLVDFQDQYTQADIDEWEAKMQNAHDLQKNIDHGAFLNFKDNKPIFDELKKMRKEAKEATRFAIAFFTKVME